MDCQKIIETFFSMLGRFDFDRAKTYIDGRKEVLQKLAPTCPNQAQIMTMLTTFSRLAEVEKNYHNQPFLNQNQHSFLPATGFLRKTKTLRDMYSDIFAELNQIERMESHSNISNHIEERKDIPLSIPSPISGDPVLASSTSRLLTIQNCPKQIIDNTEHQSSTGKESPANQMPQSPVSAFKNSFFRVLSPISSQQSLSPSLQQHQSVGVPLSSDVYSVSSSSGYEPPPNSTTTTPVSYIFKVREFSEELISHFCRQLQNFIQARLDLIDLYEKFTEASTKKCASIDSIAFRLSMLCRQYHKSFHHPLLAPIKEGMTLECESLMTLLRATIDLRHWRFLPTLFDLQEAQSKLNYWASNTFNKEASRRRFKVSKSQSAPRLYEWLCRFKEFLIAKFTIYFQATLSKNFPPSFIKSNCSKLHLDYYSKLTSFQRKIDALFIALMFDVSSEKDFRGLGYNFPSKDYQHPQGKNTLQSMIVIPAENKAKLVSLQAEIYMIAVTNHQVMIKEGQYQFHDNIKKLTYSIAKPDPNVVLVIVCEGHKVDREALVRAFSLEIINSFSFSNIFAS